MIALGDVETIRVGSRVKLHDQDGEDDLCVVRPEEADPFTGLVSVESPLGRALIGRSAGDCVNVRTPGGVRAVTVLAIFSES
jgi:transcription elongation factor GreA